MEDFIDITPIFEFLSGAPPAVYGLYSGGRLLYIGKTANLTYRIRSWWEGMYTTSATMSDQAIVNSASRAEVLAHNFGQVKYKRYRDDFECTAYEAYFIDKYRPPYNTKIPFQVPKRIPDHLRLRYIMRLMIKSKTWRGVNIYDYIPRRRI